MSIAFTRMMSPLNTRTYAHAAKIQERNDLQAIFKSLAGGKAVVFKDTQGLVHNSPIQGIRREVGNTWLVTIHGIEVRALAA